MTPQERDLPVPLSTYDGRVAPDEPGEIRVSSGHQSMTIAWKIVEWLRANKSVRISAIGSGATNQALKGVAIARQKWRDLMDNGTDLATVPYFSVVIADHDDKERTRLVLVVFKVEDRVLQCHT